MATADSVKVKIQGLIDQSNATTGASDTDLSSAVDRLIGGYGQGGGITPANYHVLPITLTETWGNGTLKNAAILTGNEFVKAHYADDAFFAMLMPLYAADSVQDSNATTWIYHGNRAIVNCKLPVYGTRSIAKGSSTHAAIGIATTKICENGYNVSLRAKSTGDIYLYVDSSLLVPAGNYLLILALAE